MTKHLITREIGIDAGHRVTFHGSKCRNIHGHRYTIQATCSGELHDEGEQQGMVLDFGFLKEEMMSEVDRHCDHGMIFWAGDDAVSRMFEPGTDDFAFDETTEGCPDIAAWWAMVNHELGSRGYVATRGRNGMKIYIVPFIPTAENLARHWFNRLAPRVRGRSDGNALLVKVKVWETPNCSAEYPA